MLGQGMLRVRAQSALGLARRLLGALLGSRALVVDVARGLARLGIRLLLGLGGLAAGVGGGHGVVGGVSVDRLLGRGDWKRRDCRCMYVFGGYGVCGECVSFVAFPRA